MRVHIPDSPTSTMMANLIMTVSPYQKFRSDPAQAVYLHLEIVFKTNEIALVNLAT